MRVTFLSTLIIYLPFFIFSDECLPPILCEPPYVGKRLLKMKFIWNYICINEWFFIFFIFSQGSQRVGTTNWRHSKAKWSTSPTQYQNNSRMYTHRLAECIGTCSEPSLQRWLFFTTILKSWNMNTTTILNSWNMNSTTI